MVQNHGTLFYFVYSLSLLRLSVRLCNFWPTFLERKTIMCYEYHKHEFIKIATYTEHIDGLEQERHNSIANALELRLSCINPSTYKFVYMIYEMKLDCHIANTKRDSPCKLYVLDVMWPNWLINIVLCFGKWLHFNTLLIPLYQFRLWISVSGFVKPGWWKQGVQIEGKQELLDKH